MFPDPDRWTRREPGLSISSERCVPAMVMTEIARQDPLQLSLVQYDKNNEDLRLPFNYWQRGLANGKKQLD